MRNMNYKYSPSNEKKVYVSAILHHTIVSRVVDFSYCHFSDDRIISSIFLIIWHSRFQVLNPCDFWIYGYLRSSYRPIKSLFSLKDYIESMCATFWHNTLQLIIIYTMFGLQAVKEMVIYIGNSFLHN